MIKDERNGVLMLNSRNGINTMVCTMMISQLNAMSVLHTQIIMLVIWLSAMVGGLAGTMVIAVTIPALCCGIIGKILTHHITKSGQPLKFLKK